jgi:glycine/D-amino acid oxidase-like deaminating enzyme
VALIEADEIGGGATKAGMGHIVVLGDSDAEFVLSKLSAGLWRELGERLPDHCEFWQCGTIWVAGDETEWDLAQERCAYYRNGGVEAELLKPRELAEYEPNLRQDLAGALFIPGDMAVSPRRVAAFLQSKDDLIRSRATTLSDDRILLEDGTTIRAAAYINAAGVAASKLSPELPVRPRKGHILVVQAPAGFARHEVMELGYLKSTHASEEASVVFNVRQRRDGGLLVGSSRDFSEDPQIDTGTLERMRHRAAEFMPAIAGLKQVDAWTGFRASTPDGLPLIGVCPGSDRIYAATGHEGLGVTMSLGTARLLADIILKRDRSVDPAPFDPARFRRVQ